MNPAMICWVFLLGLVIFLGFVCGFSLSFFFFILFFSIAHYRAFDFFFFPTISTGTNTLLLTLQPEPSFHFSSVLTILCWSYPGITNFSRHYSNAFKYRINFKQGFMQRKVTPVSSEADTQFLYRTGEWTI